MSDRVTTRTRTSGLIGSKSLPATESNGPAPVRSASTGLIGSKRLPNSSQLSPHHLYGVIAPSKPPPPPPDSNSAQLDDCTTGMLSTLSELSSPETSGALGPARIIVKDKETGRAYVVYDDEELDRTGKQTLVDLATNSHRTFKYTTLTPHPRSIAASSQAHGHASTASSWCAPSHCSVISSRTEMSVKRFTTESNVDQSKCCIMTRRALATDSKAAESTGTLCGTSVNLGHICGLHNPLRVWSKRLAMQLWCCQDASI
jgi:hypothetical protein